MCYKKIHPPSHFVGANSAGESAHKARVGQERNGLKAGGVVGTRWTRQHEQLGLVRMRNSQCGLKRWEND